MLCSNALKSSPTVNIGLTLHELHMFLRQKIGLYWASTVFSGRTRSCPKSQVRTCLTASPATLQSAAGNPAFVACAYVWPMYWKCSLQICPLSKYWRIFQILKLRTFKPACNLQRSAPVTPASWHEILARRATATIACRVFSVEAVALCDIGLRDASDQEIFSAARQAGAVVITKDSDFAEQLYRLGAPPKIVWITCGNASNAHMKQLLGATFRDAINLLEAGETLVEIAEK